MRLADTIEPVRLLSSVERLDSIKNQNLPERTHAYVELLFNNRRFVY